MSCELRAVSCEDNDSLFGSKLVAQGSKLVFDAIIKTVYYNVQTYNRNNARRRNWSRGDAGSPQGA